MMEPVESFPMNKPTKEKTKKTYTLSLNRELMLEVQHMALDQDRYANEIVEEALKDVLKKYREKGK